jgi:hypothetical protein
MGSKLIIGLLLTVSCFGQQGNTVFVPMAINLTDSPATYLVPSQYMIGQSGHEAAMSLSDVVGQTCDTTTELGTIQIQGSFDNTSWFGLTLIATTNSLGSALASTQGVFPYIRIVVTNAVPAQCAYTVYYGGTPGVLASTSSTFTYNNNVARSSISASTTGSATSVVLGASGDAANSVFVDCISVSLTALSTLPIGGWKQTVSSSYLDQGSFGLDIGLPNCALAGATVTRDVCGLNVYVGKVSQSPTILISGSGDASVQQSLNVTWYLTQ